MRLAETPLSCNKARYYNPVIGRFVSEDPIRLEATDLQRKGSFQRLQTFPIFLPLYTYTDNKPEISRDPLGLRASSSSLSTASKWIVTVLTGGAAYVVTQGCTMLTQECERAKNKCKEELGAACVDPDKEINMMNSYGVSQRDALQEKVCGESNWPSCKKAVWCFPIKWAIDVADHM